MISFLSPDDRCVPRNKKKMIHISRNATENNAEDHIPKSNRKVNGKKSQMHQSVLFPLFRGIKSSFRFNLDASLGLRLFGTDRIKIVECFSVCFKRPRLRSRSELCRSDFTFIKVLR
ncbi:hypothetical protein TNCT_455361 [Trichonephila clavata]|uniref:Uncharacterized protein n=1 Tax=Trichonephila clavata TaxID=2740835 RepID=A0A8X6F9V5_TRICU|nr:hypothetical protein TNCT_455361 [Trichonephila clavata]